MTLVHEQFTKVKKHTIDKTVTRHLIDLFEPYTLENYPFEDVFPIKTGDFPGFSDSLISPAFMQDHMS